MNCLLYASHRNVLMSVFIIRQILFYHQGHMLDIPEFFVCLCFKATLIILIPLSRENNAALLVVHCYKLEPADASSQAVT